MNECTYSKRGIVVGCPVRERDLSHFQIVQAICGVHLTHGSMVVREEGVFYRRYIGCIVNLTTHLHLVPSVNTGGAIPLLPNTFSWPTKDQL